MRYLIVLCLLMASTLAKNVLVSNEVHIRSNPNSRIIGGEIAADGEYPHMVSIRTYRPDNHQCGGVIIHEEWVLTAGHCAKSDDPIDYHLVAGSNKLSEGGVFLRVREVHIHELYDDENFLNDVAILKVEKIKFTDKVDKIKLGKSFVGGDVSVTISGWGVTSPGGTQSNDLKHLTYNTTTVEECKKRLLLDRDIDETHLCTLHKAGIGACHQDSGSPLIRSVDGVRYLVGIVSGGPECASGYYPDVYSRISAFVPWINKICNCNL